jgi:hypothetical protein
MLKSSQRQGDELIGQKQQPHQQLDGEDGRKIVRLEHHSHVLQRQAGGRRLFDEVEEAVQSEDGEHESEKVTGDSGCDFHKSESPYIRCLHNKCCLSST